LIKFTLIVAYIVILKQTNTSHLFMSYWYALVYFRMAIYWIM